MKRMRPGIGAFCAGLTVLLTGTVAVAQATHLGSDLPLFGDSGTAARLVKAGNTVFNEGNAAEAKADYAHALEVSQWYEDAILGLAHCAAREGDFATAASRFRDAISGPHEEDNIALMTEYALVLSQAGSSREAVRVYNLVVQRCVLGYQVTEMDVPLPTFRSGGAGTGLPYSPTRMQAMTHVIRAMNAGTSDRERIALEMKEALTLLRRSSIVYFYQGVLLSQTDRAGARSAFQQALALDDGSNMPVIREKLAALDQGEPAAPTTR